MRMRSALFGLVSLAGLGAPRAADQAGSELKWTVLQPGLEYATAEAPGARELQIDGHIHLVRVDPKQRKLEAVMAGAGDGRLRTAEQ